MSENISLINPSKENNIMNGTSFFNIDLVTEIENMELNLAKKKIIDVVQSSNAQKANKTKALTMINKCMTVKRLMEGMVNFMMSHPSEGLGGNRIG